MFKLYVCICIVEKILEIEKTFSNVECGTCYNKSPYDLHKQSYSFFRAIESAKGHKSSLCRCGVLLQPSARQHCTAVALYATTSRRYDI